MLRASALLSSAISIFLIYRINDSDKKSTINEKIVVVDAKNKTSITPPPDFRSHHSSRDASNLKSDYPGVVHHYDPVLDGVIGDTQSGSATDPAELYKKLRNEKRDPFWAPAAEKSLTLKVRDVPYLDSEFPLTILCGATICELSGHIRGDITLENANAAISKVQQPDFNQGGSEIRFDPNFSNIIFGPSKSFQQGSTFVRYFRRK